MYWRHGSSDRMLPYVDCIKIFGFLFIEEEGVIGIFLCGYRICKNIINGVFQVENLNSNSV
jgi:hypothetical protein